MLIVTEHSVHQTDLLEVSCLTHAAVHTTESFRDRAASAGTTERPPMETFADPLIDGVPCSVSPRIAATISRAMGRNPRSANVINDAYINMHAADFTRFFDGLDQDDLESALLGFSRAYDRALETEIYTAREVRLEN